MKFTELGLSKSLLNAINSVGYTEATPIQVEAIPIILNKKDIIGVAQTGTGKTAAFALPILENLIKENNPNRKIKVLILSPTRELALQIRDNIRDYSFDTKFKCSVVLGGVNQKSQIDVLKRGVDILIATPGRLVDLTKRKLANLSNVDVLVLDEADTMLDMGFIKDVKYLINKTPTNRQTLLFSATISKEIKALSQDILNNPVEIITTPTATPVDRIKQLLYYVDKKNKINLLLDILKTDIKSVLVFTRTKHGADKLEEQLNKNNIRASVIHGNKSQANRVQALKDFKNGKTKILIATDIAARGIDINELSHVINYDIPEQPEIYIHRIGRTARAGLNGTAISMCSNDELYHLKEIEKLINQKINVVSDHNYKMAIKEEVKKPHRGKNKHFNRKRNNRYNTKNNSK